MVAEFIVLAEGRETTNPHISRLDRASDVCHVIRQAQQMSDFTEQLKANVR